MNYRHQFHAGNFADVIKHTLLVQLIRAMQRKEGGFLYVDTHAGAGRYKLELADRGTTLERRPEYPMGVGRLWAKSALPTALADYVDLVKRFNRQSGGKDDQLTMYPGSPWFASMLARPADRLALVELEPSEEHALARQFDHETNTRVHLMDGYTALKALLPPQERRALVLVDPPFEAQREYQQILEGIAGGLKRFPTGVYMVWYPITARAKSDAFLAGLATTSSRPVINVEIMVAGTGSLLKMRGCGLAIVNPPWLFEAELENWFQTAVGLLKQEHGAEGAVRWIVRETTK